MVDDRRHGSAGVAVYGSTAHQTPNIDWLATEGVCFREAYTENSIC